VLPKRRMKKGDVERKKALGSPEKRMYDITGG
jgi:hypothetical protein